MKNRPPASSCDHTGRTERFTPPGLTDEISDGPELHRFKTDRAEKER
jgi:hypothetical protein